MTFVFEKVTAKSRPAGEFSIELFFDLVDDEFRLGRLRFDSQLSALVNTSPFEQDDNEKVAVNICEAKLFPPSMRMTCDIPENEPT